jgi:hypothetical protein
VRSEERAGRPCCAAHDLKRAHPFLAGQHEMSDLEPVAQRLVCILKDRAGNVREAIARLWRALVALAMIKADSTVYAASWRRSGFPHSSGARPDRRNTLLHPGTSSRIRRQ